MKRKLCTALAILLCAFPSMAIGDEASGIAITIPGSAYVSFYDGLHIQTYLEANKSYTCTLARVYLESSSFIFSQHAESATGDLNGRYVGEVTPVNTGGGTGYVNQSRLSLLPTVSQAYVLTLEPSAEITSFTSDVGSVTCVETTLYGGFNTNVNEYNFLELANTTNSSINVKVRAVDSQGTVVIDNQEVTVDAGVRKDVDLHSLVGSGKYGSVIVMHDGPLGAIKGSVSQYKIQSDGSFLPTQFLQLEPQSNVSPLPAARAY